MTDRPKTPARRVLVIDDDDAVRAVAAAALGRVGGWDVSTASSGEEGIEAAQRLVPDAIVLDVMMPEVDGPTVLERLRRDPATRAIPVVFLTARVAGPGHGALDSMDVAGVLIKPFDPMTLSRDLCELIGFGP
jgi:CheY-like chemotaxis protein